ncbi:MAG: hypothetical protein WC781_03985 [Candidatus Pacearchaeota archaeon]
MDSFIKKIFEGRVDNSVHIQFQKFSRGEFRDRAMINASKSKDKYSIATTYEYAVEFVRSVAEKILAGQKVKVTGVVVSTRDLKGELNFKSIKQFMGIKQYILDDLMSKEDILKLCDKFPNSFLGLSFSVGDTELKIKPKAPKSAKPSTSDKGPSVDFCKLKTNDLNLVKSILFDVEDFKKVQISHEFLITDIEIPKNESDPAKMREMAIRKGKIVRHLNLDGKLITKDILFQA